MRAVTYMLCVSASAIPLVAYPHDRGRFIGLLKVLPRHHAPGREIEAFGLPTLPAAAALGNAFLSTSGLHLIWRQFMPDRTEQLWSLSQARVDTGFAATLSSKDAGARDIAVLVSVADNTQPLFAAHQSKLPSLRALVHVAKKGAYPHRLSSPGEAADVAFIVQDGLRAARRDYGDVGIVHLFMAVPAGLAVLIGQLLNTFGSVQTYEHVAVDGSGQYRAAALLRP
jgi:SMODS-associated and fused to various effectors sensor domain